MGDSVLLFDGGLITSYNTDMLLGDQTLLAINHCMVLSFAPFITSRGLLKLEKGPSCAKGCRRLIRHAKGQAGRRVDAGVAEVEA